MLSTVSVTATAGRMPDALEVFNSARKAGDAELAAVAGSALIHGYSLGLVTAALALLAAAAIVALLVNAKRDQAAVAVTLH